AEMVHRALRAVRLVTSPACGKAISDRLRLEPVQIEPVHFVQQFHECAGAVFERRLAFLRARGARIAGRTRSIEVLGHPAQPGGRLDPEIAELPCRFAARGPEVTRTIRADQIRTRYEHDRRLDGSRMDPVHLLLARKEPLRIAEPEPGAGDREHAEAHAQIARDEVEHRDVAAMAVEEDDLAHTRAIEAL